MDLNAIAQNHSFEAGFNGRLAKYRISMLSVAIANLEITKRILEVGAGEGIITEYLLSRFSVVDAIEPAAPYFLKLQERFKGRSELTLYNDTLEQITLHDRYPLVVAAGVLEHVKDAQAFLAKINDVLEPGGLLLGTVPNATSLHRRIGVSMGMIPEVHYLSEQDIKVGHYRYYDFEMLEAELYRAGFCNIQLSGIMLKPFPNSKMDELSEIYCDALFQVGQLLPEWGAEIFFCAQKRST